MSSLYNLVYLDYNGFSEPAVQPPFLPINYEEGTINMKKLYAWR
jgi:hypothetical protein